ncbi:Slp family lipoprotein [Alteromonas sp. a30]|uniref:Slp family lipoprotein n=1 Tax=Alteromonas sp. a30 TaxID=2730917 RepID=UPI00227F7995|nr:Slp family lipoprotein [Alteromonas sp. a30]MCY7296819.1 Slp family lipoprotein [Alteromonas sp. a30]
MFLRTVMLAGVLLLSGCASFPESVQLPPDTPTVSYEQVASEPERAKDQLAQWGGVVAQIQNLKDATMVEMVFYPLRSYGRPLLGKESIGRFRVYVDGFLDPMVYQKGRSMTFSGVVQGVEEGMVGEHQYIFPTLKAKGYYLWEDIDRIDVTSVSVWPYPYYGGWYGRRYWDGWYGTPFYTQQHTIRIKHDHYRYSNDASSNSSVNQPAAKPKKPPVNKTPNVDPRPALKKAAKGGKNIP